MKNCLIACLLCLSVVAHAQEYNDILRRDTQVHLADSNLLSFRLDYLGLFKNNEYFGNFAEGFTLPAWFAQPRLVYQPGTSTRIEAGAHLLQYFGLQEITQVQPIVSFHYRFSPFASVVLGSLYGGTNHRLTEPLYRFERHLEQQLENGVQLLTHQPRWESDTWVNWQQFVFASDPFQEQFAFGSTHRFWLTDRDEKLSILFHGQLLGQHLGGQINNSPEPVSTIINTSFGTEVTSRWKNPKPGNFGARLLLYTYNDLEADTLQAFDRGSAVYISVYGEYANFGYLAGYWRGTRFVAPYGEPLFHSISSVQPELVQEDRELLTLKLFFQKYIRRELRLGVRAEGYFDTMNTHLDYSASIFMVYQPEFRIGRLAARY